MDVPEQSRPGHSICFRDDALINHLTAERLPPNKMGEHYFVELVWRNMNDSSRRTDSWPSRHAKYERQLRKSNADWFADRKFVVNHKMPYLLERWDDWPKNIIMPEVAHYIQAEQKRRHEANERFPLHKYLHHGLSSQAMLFNLVGPLVVEKDLAPLKLAFERGGIDWPLEVVTPIFEVENRKIFNEDTGQPTSIDLVIQGKDNTHSLFIETKLVEREFGGCSVFEGGDCDGRNPSRDFSRCYLHHIGRRYWILLDKLITGHIKERRLSLKFHSCSSLAGKT